MPTPDQFSMIRLDIDDPKDVQYLVNTGYAWRSGPKTLQKIVLMIADEKVARNPAKEPPEITAFLDRLLADDEEEPELLNPLADETSGLAGEAVDA